MDKDTIYFMPGCALELYKSESVAKIYEYLQQHITNIKIYKTCCRHEMTIPKGSTIIYTCSSCAMRLRVQDHTLKFESLWSILNKWTDFIYPSYQGLQVSIHDSCTAKATPDIHEDIRHLLKNMDIQIVESKNCGMKSVCCGDNLYPSQPIEKVKYFMKKRAESMPCEYVAVYCVSCMNAIYTGGKTPLLLTDLILGEKTQVEEIDLEKWRNTLVQYIEKH